MIFWSVLSSLTMTSIYCLMFIKKSCDALTKFRHYTGQKYQLDVYKVLLLYLKIRQSLLQVGKIFIVNNGLEGQRHKDFILTITIRLFTLVFKLSVIKQ